MESEELKRRFTPKVLSKRISGQRLLPTHDFKSFKYGASRKSGSRRFSSCTILAGSRERHFSSRVRHLLGLSQSAVLSLIFGKSENRIWTATTRNLKRTDRCSLRVSPLSKARGSRLLAASGPDSCMRAYGTKHLP